MTVRSYNKFLVSSESTAVEILWNAEETGELNTLYGKEKPELVFKAQKVIIIKEHGSEWLNTAERSASYACTCWRSFGNRIYIFSVY